MNNVSESALYINEVCAIDNMLVLAGEIMPPTDAKRKADLRARLDNAQTEFNTLFREEKVATDEDSAVTASRGYSRMVAPIRRAHDAISGERAIITVPNDKEYKPGMVYLMQQKNLS